MSTLHRRRHLILVGLAMVAGSIAGSIQSPRAMAAANMDPIEVSDAIPLSPRSRNAVTGDFQFDGTAIVTGKGDLRAPDGKVPSGSEITSVKTVADSASVRMLFNKDRAASLLGAVMNTAASVDGLYLEDDQANKYQPIGYIVAKNDTLTVSINPEAPVQSMKEFPNVGDKDKLYVYFRIPHGTKIVKIYAGKRHVEKADLAVP